MNDFLSKMKEFADKGIEVSKDALDKASGTVHTWSDKGVTKVELMQLNKQAQKQFTRLGIQIFDLLSLQEKKTVSSEDEYIAEILGEIARLKEEISKKEAE